MNLFRPNVFIYCSFQEPDETDLGTEGKYGGGDDNTGPATGGTDFDDVIKYYNDTNSNNTNGEKMIHRIKDVCIKL